MFDTREPPTPLINEFVFYVGRHGDPFWHMRARKVNWIQQDMNADRWITPRIRSGDYETMCTRSDVSYWEIFSVQLSWKRLYAVRPRYCASFRGVTNSCKYLGPEGRHAHDPFRKTHSVFFSNLEYQTNTNGEIRPFFWMKQHSLTAFRYHALRVPSWYFISHYQKEVTCVHKMKMKGRWEPSDVTTVLVYIKGSIWNQSVNIRLLFQKFYIEKKISISTDINYLDQMVQVKK